MCYDMWTDKSVSRISDNIVTTNGKAGALLASSFKGFAANGNCNVIELYERE